MRITEALKLLHGASKTSPPFQVALACGFTPLHLSTFLAAHLQLRLNNRQVAISPGLYGDLAGTVESLAHSSPDAVAIALEWPDFDARLGFRSEAAWGAASVDDILAQVPRSLHRLQTAIQAIPAGIPVALSLPTLPMPPIFHTSGWQSAEAETKLDLLAAEFAAGLPSRVRIVNARRLAEESGPAQRFDLKSDLTTGLPYTVTHADSLAAAFSHLLIPAPPKKGLITDLDDTLWSGLVGEVGPDAVCWDLAGHKAIHGLYQRLLASLAEEGTLIAVASKNDPAVAARAFERQDLFLPAASIFPMEVHWEAKSGSVARILRQWNIAADSVVFVDDSPLELAEVAAAHPGIECIQFGGNGHHMLRRIRDLFAKARLSQEDSLRANSLRARTALPESNYSSEDFLRQLNATVTVDFDSTASDGRVLDLINKTNQFNLNGIRYTEAEWSKRLLARDSVLAVVAYEDRYGPLGRISVLQGTLNGGCLHVDVWVLSCRAFARRIEHQLIQSLFDRFGVHTIEFAFARTAKNSPIADFLAKACDSEWSLTRRRFDQFRPALFLTVNEARKVEVNG